MTDETGAQLAIIPDMQLPAPGVIKEKMQGAFSKIYADIEAEIAEMEVDLSTDAGRKRVASLAYKIAQTKTGLDGTAQQLTADQKEMIDAVNAERREMKERMDALKAKARAPLTEWEKAEDARKQKVGDAFAGLATFNTAIHEMDIATLEGAINEQIRPLEPCDRATFGDLADEFDKTVLLAVERAQNHLETLRQAEADRLELEQMRAEKAAAEEKARLEAEAAAEAERQKQAEIDRQAAQEAAEAHAARVAEEARQRAEAEAAERIRAAEEAAEAAANEAAEREARIEREATERAEAAERAKKEREAQYLAQMEAQKQQAAKEAEEAAQRERDRAAAEVKAAEEAEAARRADEDHRRKINHAAMEAVVKLAGVTETEAKAIITAISSGKVPHTSIRY